jgi:hypothetical protein
MKLIMNRTFRADLVLYANADPETLTTLTHIQ